MEEINKSFGDLVNKATSVARQSAKNEMQSEVEKYFKNILNLPCPDFRENVESDYKIIK
jgi:hypothetical protein